MVSYPKRHEHTTRRRVHFVSILLKVIHTCTEDESYYTHRGSLNNGNLFKKKKKKCENALSIMHMIATNINATND